jgi:single-strand DNA-binding protein
VARKEVNAVTLTGLITAEPEMRFTAEGEMFTTFSVACRQPTPHDQQASERFCLVAWGQPLAEQCNDLLPGAHVLITGRLQSSTSEDPTERASIPFEVIVREVLVLSSLPAEYLTISPVPTPRASPASTARSTAPLPPATPLSPPQQRLSRPVFTPPTAPAVPGIPRGPQRDGSRS